MIFETDGFSIDAVEPTDLGAVLAVYQSNKDFLLHHTGRNAVTSAWLQSELEAMKAAGFCSCKVVEKHSGSVIGIADVRLGEETYLSLMMLRRDYQNKGLGKQIYRAMEAYVKARGSTSIRIDVVTGYSNSALPFWRSRGFIKVREITLNWAGKSLPAVMMKKELPQDL
ncbi:MAG TPA: GNAT family N-acetyltransferase [Feifaniaceae bacterium]|nr:GNAT family N-acetyltransferase [Feifaniaceae bacterium]